MTGLRDQALAAARQAIRDGQWWLPPAGQAELVDAILAVVPNATQGAHTMPVQRITTEHGSHIEPALDPNWPEFTRLAWKGAVTELDAGLRVQVFEMAPGQYSVQVGSRSASTCSFDFAWTYLTGVSVGAIEAQRAG